MNWRQLGQTSRMASSVSTGRIMVAARTIGAAGPHLSRIALGRRRRVPGAAEEVLDGLDEHLDRTRLDQEAVAAGLVGQPQRVRGVVPGDGDDEGQRGARVGSQRPGDFQARRPVLQEYVYDGDV